MTTRSMMEETTSLLRLVERRVKLKKELEENEKKQQPLLPEDCIFNIIVRLPLEFLQSSRFVCKAWYGIVNSPAFIDAHLQRSDVGLIFLTPARKGLPCSDARKASGSSVAKIKFSVESKVSELQTTPIHHSLTFKSLPSSDLSQIKFMEIKDGKRIIKDYNATCTGQIKATFNGLIILENGMKRGGLIVLNPVTRELKTIPLGTISKPRLESYGLAFCHDSGRHKLVHLFQDDLKYVNCEIMYIGRGSWRMVDGPPNGFFGWLGHQPIFAIGALHWIPHVDHNEYIVSMPMNSEKFEKILLPDSGGSNDRILEMGGFLGFVTRQSAYQIDVWILRSLGGEGWAKQNSICLDWVRILVPLYCKKLDGELVFKCDDNNLYAYDQILQIMRTIEVNKERFPLRARYFPHVNSLVSLKN